MLKGKTVLLGVTGGIACYKSAGLASALVKQGANVQVLMTRNATEFIGPHTFESLTGNRVSVDTFDRNYQFQVEHIALADQADLVLVAPATANVLAKLAHGLADDMLTTTVLACDCPKIAAPAMNTRMYENPVTQDNLALLRRYGWEIVEPASGRLACGAVGKGKMPELEELLETVLHALSHAKDMEGLKVLVTAGPTQEALDPVRCLTNHSTGRMGYAVARAAAARGAEVTLVSGPTALKKPAYVETVDVVSAQDMFEAVTARAPEQDIIIKAAAVADYRGPGGPGQGEEGGGGAVHSPGAHPGYPGLAGGAPRAGAVPVRVFYGDPGHGGKLPQEAGEEAPGSDCRQQPQGAGRGLRSANQSAHADLPPGGAGAAPPHQGGGRPPSAG